MGAWKNQYIDLVTAKPGYIYAESDQVVSVETITTIRNRCKDFAETFVELGSGSGGHLIELAAQNPKAMCVGFELRFKRTFKTGEKAEQRGLDNVAMVRSNARNLSSVFEPHSIDRLYINFPDPWAKKRWLKNRMVNSGFIESLPTLLRTGGVFRYKTDHQNAFDDAVALVTANPRLQMTKVTRDLYSSEFLPESIPTEFEQLFLSQGLPIHFLECSVL